MSRTSTLDQCAPAVPDELLALALDAVLFTLPLYEMTRMRAAASSRRDDAGRFAGGSPDSTLRWVNRWVHTRQLLGPRNREVVTPNNDTLYSSVWLDLSEGPLLLHVPDMGTRYYVLGLLDFYTNPFGYIGSRTTGSAAGTFLLHGPDWQGVVPEGARALSCPTPSVWMIGRLLIDGPDDLAEVIALQDRLVIEPLAEGGAQVPRLIDAGMRAQDRAGDPVQFARIVNRALAENPAAAEAAAMLERFAACGIGASCDADALTDVQRDALSRAIAQTIDTLSAPQPSALGGGWFLPVDVSESFGTRYTERAQVALNYIGALGVEEAMYVVADRDADDMPLDGATSYVLHFPPGGQLQTDAFWSITAYDKASCLLVENGIERYSVGDRTPGLRFDEDGGLRIAISAREPRDAVLRANWLPAPGGSFYLAMRLYCPREVHLARGFLYPAVTRDLDLPE
ncbi:DUF1254 domain-containing protein [Paraburkholderia fungorum]|uniref:DUF1254 domain-containing protein n=1 Tax=Paraburkholderia fungorum TaxID=134537 RepID=UPI0038B9CE5A